MNYPSDFSKFIECKIILYILFEKILYNGNKQNCFALIQTGKIRQASLNVKIDFSISIIGEKVLLLL